MGATTLTNLLRTLAAGIGDRDAAPAVGETALEDFAEQHHLSRQAFAAQLTREFVQFIAGHCARQLAPLLRQRAAATTPADLDIIQGQIDAEWLHTRNFIWGLFEEVWPPLQEIEAVRPKPIAENDQPAAITKGQLAALLARLEKVETKTGITPQ